MNYIFDFKGRKYSYNSDTQELLRVTETGTVPVSIDHPSLIGIKEVLKDYLTSR